MPIKPKTNEEEQLDYLKYNLIDLHSLDKQMNAYESRKAEKGFSFLYFDPANSSDQYTEAEWLIKLIIERIRSQEEYIIFDKIDYSENSTFMELTQTSMQSKCYILYVDGKKHRKIDVMSFIEKSINQNKSASSKEKVIVFICFLHRGNSIAKEYPAYFTKLPFLHDQSDNPEDCLETLKAEFSDWISGRMRLMNKCKGGLDGFIAEQFSLDCLHQERALLLHALIQEFVSCFFKHDVTIERFELKFTPL